MTIDRYTELSTSASHLVRNSVFNLIGYGVPLLAALIAIPPLINGLGIDRFGVLTLAWLVIGYFSLFDFGLGRAITQVLAERLASGQDTQAHPVVWAAIVMMLVLGLLATLVVSLISPWLVHSGFKVPAPLQIETLYSFYLLAAFIPLVVVTGGLIGLLSAFQRFVLINTIRVPMGVLGFLAPLAVLPYSHELPVITAALVFVRVLAFGAFVIACWKLIPPPPSEFRQQATHLRRLLHFGAWTTVSNVISPIMVYVDRFVIGAIISVAAVAYYATPFEVVTKLLIIPGAIMGVLFPAFAASHVHDHDRMVRIFTRGTKYIALILFPFILLITAFAHEGLQWWLGEEFARYSAPVLRWLAVGVFINGLAQSFATLVQGVGRPDIGAKLHLVELPLYLVVLWWAIESYGIVGAAMAWTARVALDCILLLWLSTRFLGDNVALLVRLVVGIVVAVSGIVLPLIAGSATTRAVMVFFIMVGFVAIARFMVLCADERHLFKASIGLVHRL